MPVRPTPSLPFPAIHSDPPPVPSPDNVPRWSVQRFPCVGTNAVRLIGFDGEGYPLYEFTCPCDEPLEFWERVIGRQVEARRDRKGSVPSFLPPTLRLL